jgi:hypothetical protein
MTLGGVIAAAMVINMVIAGLAGTTIPIMLDKAGADPAIASSVFLTTVTDVVGFFAFLGLAALVLLGHALEFAWLVLPAYYPHHWPLGWRSPVALLTLAAPGLLLIQRYRSRRAEGTP